MKQIRVAVTDADDCFRCEGILNGLNIPFRLIVQADSNLLIGLEDRFARPALDGLHQAGFTATDI